MALFIQDPFLVVSRLVIVPSEADGFPEVVVIKDVTVEIVAAEEEDGLFTAIPREIACVYQIQARRDVDRLTITPHLARKDSKITTRAAE